MKKCSKKDGHETCETYFRSTCEVIDIEKETRYRTEGSKFIMEVGLNMGL